MTGHIEPVVCISRINKLGEVISAKAEIQR